MITRRLALAGVGALCGCGVASTPASASVPLAAFPQRRDPACGNGRARLYDECGSQVTIFNAAQREAAASGRVVLVNFGAEWCIWCHVFAAYLAGQSDRFRYPAEGEDVTLHERDAANAASEASALNAFAAQNFVLAHIESDNAPDGWSVLESAGAASHFNDNYPFIFSVTAAGRFAARFEYQRAEIRRDTSDWYRGYNRRALRAELERMRDAARAPA